MAETLIHVKPIAGARVRLEGQPALLPEAGARVRQSQYWLRRIAAGEVELVAETPAARAPRASAAPMPRDKE